MVWVEEGWGGWDVVGGECETGMRMAVGACGRGGGWGVPKAVFH